MNREQMRQFLLEQAAEAQQKLWRFMDAKKRRACLAANLLWKETDAFISLTLDRYAELYNEQPPNP